MTRQLDPRPELADALVAAAWTMDDLGLTTGLDSGDASIFDRENGIIYALPSPSERLPLRSWKDVRREDISLLNSDGSMRRDSYTEPTVEFPMHLAIYQARNDIKAIVHSHAENSQVFASLERDIPTSTIDSYTRLGFGPVVCGEFGIVASTELGENMVKALGEHRKAALMARHGAVAIGVDIADALFTATVVEKAARQAMHALSLNLEPRQLSLEDIFDKDTVEAIESGRMSLDVQTVTVRKLI